MKRINRYTAIPEAILDKIDEGTFSPIMRGKAIKFINLLINKGMQKNYDLSLYVHLPKNYLVKVFNSSRYKCDFLTFLKKQGIIEVNDHYLPMYGDGVPKSYRINQEMLNGEFIPTTFLDSSGPTRSLGSPSPSSSLPLPHTDLIHICGAVFPKTIITNDLKQLLIDRDRLRQMTLNKINSISFDSFLIDDEIDCNYMTVYIDGFGYELERYKVDFLRKELGKTLIQDGDHYYIEDLDKFIEAKKKNIMQHYKLVITKLVKQVFYANRNETNNRLDHNLTSLSSTLLNVIKEDNDLVEIDLHNSQFAILSYLMKKESIDTPDALTFYSLCAQNKLYSFVEDLINEKQNANKKPKAGKRAMFELSFSSHKNNTTNKAKVKRVFPTVVKYIDDFKKRCKKPSGFAIWLQKEESNIFIDGIYYQLKQKGFWIIPKHDSLIVRKNDHEEVYKFVRSYLDKIGLYSTLSNELFKIGSSSPYDPESVSNNL